MAVAAPFVISAAEAVFGALVVIYAAIKFQEAGKTIAAMFGERAPSSVNDCPAKSKAETEIKTKDDQRSKCGDLIAKMRAYVEELKKREAEMLTDHFDLYKIRPNKIPGIGSWPGHQEQFRVKQNAIKNLIREARGNGCVVPPDVIEWVNKAPPDKPLRYQGTPHP